MKMTRAIRAAFRRMMDSAGGRMDDATNEELALWFERGYWEGFKAAKEEVSGRGTFRKPARKQKASKPARGSK